MTTHGAGSTGTLFLNDSEMAGRFRAFDWSQTPLGSLETWSQCLRAAVGICLNSPIPMFVWWGDDLINIYNDAYAVVLGKRHPEALGMPARVIWTEIWAQIEEGVTAVIKYGKAVSYERMRLVLERNGYPEETYFTYSHSPIPDDHGGIGGLFQVCIDETAQVLAEREQAHLAQQRQLALDAAAMGWWHYDPHTKVATWDDRYKEIFGVTGHQRLNEEILARIHPDDLPGVWAAVESALDPLTSRPYSAQYRIRLDGGKMRWINAHGIATFEGEGVERQATSLVGTVTDITELRQLEEKLYQSQKMEGIGRLAGGIAHDFNNLLTAIQGFTQLAAEEVAEQPEAVGYLKNVLLASDRAAGLTRQLLAFARRQVMEPQVIDLNALVLNLDKMLRRLIGEDIEVVVMTTPHLWAVHVDPGQMEQVILNLSVNARDAMPEGGKLTLETSNVTLDETYTRQHLGSVPGDYVMLSVSDTGVGMPPEVQSRIFEPFFTTKEVGKGTGLGLATCYGIVKQFGGNIWVYSEEGQGTTFKVYLPRTEQPVAEKAKPKAKAVLPRGGETVLLVEDEPWVRAVASEALRAQGYVVLEANSGSDALKMAEEYSGVIDLVLTDVVMPQMNGKPMVEQLQRKRAGITVLYMSGYTDNGIVHHGVLEAGLSFLQKPFTTEALLRKVREVLDAPREASPKLQ